MLEAAVALLILLAEGTAILRSMDRENVKVRPKNK